MSHPSSLALEAFACGEPSDVVAAHLETCDACREFVGRLRDFSEDGSSVGAIQAMLERSAAGALEPRTGRQTDPKMGRQTDPKSGTEDAPSAPLPLRRFWIGASTAMLPLVAAAAFVVFFRKSDGWTFEGPRPHDAPSQTVGATGPSGAETAAENDDLSPETRFKGDVQLAVVRERAGQQARFASTTLVRSGDRLRIEVALDREQVIVGGVFGDDGSYLELMPAGVRAAGTHFSEHSVRVDAQPTRGTIAVGSPEAMAKARVTNDFGGLATLRLDVEGSP